LYGSYQVFRNDDGVFTDITAELGLAGITDVGWREFFDYDNDGDFDYFKAVSDPGAAGTNEVWENQNGFFVNVTDEVGLTLSRDRYRSMTIGDFDNDGDQDIFLQLNIDPSLDVLLVNDEVAPGERAFADVAEFVGITKTGDRKGSVFFDYDRDGFLDIYLPSAEHNHILYHNLGGNNANWIGLILEGTKSNRDAVGSLVTIYTGEKKQIRYTKCGNGFVRQDNPWVHFGIGFATAVDSIVIRWPLGYRQVITNPEINQYHEIKEPDLSSVKANENASAFINTCLLFQNYPNPFNLSTKIAYEISQPSHVTLEIFDMTGKRLTTVVNKMQPAGHFENEWNGFDRENNELPTGVYFYRMRANDFTYTKKMILAK